MTKYCVLFCVGFLVLTIGCEQVKRRFDSEERDEDVTSTTRTSDDGASSEFAALQQPHGDPGPGDEVGEMSRHAVFKPTSTTKEANEPNAEAPPPLEIQAMELAVKELAMNLRLKDEQDPAKRAKLEQEIAMLREQRQLLYQQQAERDHE